MMKGWWFGAGFELRGFGFVQVTQGRQDIKIITSY